MKVTARRAKITVSADGKGIVSQGGALLLTQALRVTGLDRGLMVALERWRASRAVHDPGKIIADLVVTLALGGDGSPVTVDIDATIVTAHSEKEKAAPTWNNTYGFHPLAAFADHGAGAGGEPLAILLRPGNAGSNTAAGHIEVAKLALAQLPRKLRRRVLVRTDSGGRTHDFLNWLASPGRRLHYSAGMTITEDMQQAILALPDRVREPAYDAAGRVRPGAWVAELTGLLDLSGWPAGMRVIVRRERPHPGAQLRFTDLDRHRFTAFAIDARRGQLADLELRHRRRARCEDRIRNAKDTGLRNLPLHGFAQNQLWCELVAMASELLAWTATLALEAPRPRLGTQTPAPAAVLRRRAAGTQRPPPAAAPRRDLGLGLAGSPRRSPGCRPSPPAGQPKPTLRPGRTPQGPWNPAHPARQPGNEAQPHAETATGRSLSPATSRSRNIEVNPGT